MIDFPKVTIATKFFIGDFSNPDRIKSLSSYAPTAAMESSWVGDVLYTKVTGPKEGLPVDPPEGMREVVMNSTEWRMYFHVPQIIGCTLISKQTIDNSMWNQVVDIINDKAGRLSVSRYPQMEWTLLGETPAQFMYRMKKSLDMNAENIFSHRGFQFEFKLK